MPVPVFTSEPVPEMMPSKFVLVSLPPVVSAALPSVTVLPATPASEPMVWA